MPWIAHRLEWMPKLAVRFGQASSWARFFFCGFAEPNALGLFGHIGWIQNICRGSTLLVGRIRCIRATTTTLDPNNVWVRRTQERRQSLECNGRVAITILG